MTLQDARYRTKVWMEAYLDKDALTKDDDVTKVKYAVLFAGFPYPVQREFYSMDLLFIIGEPVTTALYNLSSKEVYGYSEQLPISIGCLDKPGITATKLKWKAETEFRRLCEDQPFGSLRLMDRRRDTTEKLGAAIYYQTELTLAYKRTSELIPTVPSITWGTSGSPTGTYVFPAVVNIEYFNALTDAKLKPPGFTGDIKQPNGDGPLRVKITGDLDCEATLKTWKRPQTTSPKTDIMKWQVLAEIKHNGGVNEPYQTLKLPWCSASGFSVRIDDYRVYQQGNDNFVEVTFEEYTNTTKSGVSIATRWNIA